MSLLIYIFMSSLSPFFSLLCFHLSQPCALSKLLTAAAVSEFVLCMLRCRGVCSNIFPVVATGSFLYAWRLALNLSRRRPISPPGWVEGCRDRPSLEDPLDCRDVRRFIPAAVSRLASNWSLPLSVSCLPSTSSGIWSTTLQHLYFLIYLLLFSFIHHHHHKAA